MCHYLSTVHWIVIVSVSVTHKQPITLGLKCDVWPSTGSNWLYQRMTTGSRPSQQQRRALCVCIYVIGQAREAKCGRVPASARANETRQNKPFSPTPSGYTPYFHTSRPGIALSLWVTSWWHSGQQTQQATRRKLSWSSSREAWVNKLNVRPQRSSW